MVIKLINFGASQRITEKKIDGTKTKSYYCPPEII